MEFLKEAKKNKRQIVRDLSKFIKIPSVLEEQPNSKLEPFGRGIKESLDWVLEKGKEMGFEVLNVDNVAGHIEFGNKDSDEIIGVLCHVDVVPADGEWKYKPFSGKVVGNRIYGRGTTDDKGPLICSLYALKILKDLGITLNKKIRLIFGTDEETSWRGINRYLQVEKMPTLGFSPDADFPIIYGEKGIMSMDLTCPNTDILLNGFISGKRYNVVPDYANLQFIDNGSNIGEEFKKYCLENNYKYKYISGHYEIYGKSAHAMEPKNGVNASILMSKFFRKYTKNHLVAFISDKLGDSRLKDMNMDFSDSKMGDLTMNLGIVNIDKDKSMAGLNFRYPIDLDINRFIELFKKKASEYGITITVKENKIPHYIDKNEDFIKVLHNAYIKYTGDDKTPLKTIGGGTYARALKKGVAFGCLFPDEEELAHQANEYANIDKLIIATAIITQAIYDLGK